MINTRPQDAYKKQDVLTAGPVDLIVMLYDALKKNIVLGKRGILKHDVTLAHKHLVKAQMIVTELINSLDMSYEISNELMSLYDFALTSLVHANTKKDAEPLDAVIDMVDNIREAWKEISSMSRGQVQLGEELA
ncbi:MAG: flagellar export chaperone FliS [Oscillospiraceae bacterium]|nr:flagellar export chaperone FliS [Oscillospiraceae bacterium]MCL2278277.1 flagellar export chaperone FliS [Oscillospiraceae bacterium]